MATLDEYVARKATSKKVRSTKGKDLDSYVSNLGGSSAFEDARKRVAERDKIFNKNEVIRRSQEDAAKYSAEADRLNAIADFPMEIGKQILQAGKETAAAGYDIGQRILPTERLRNIASGVQEAYKRPTGVPVRTAFEKGFQESKGRQTLFEKVSGENLTKEDGSVNWDSSRKFVGRAMEAPTYGFSTAFKTVGGNAIKRILSRTVQSVPEVGVITGIQQLEEGNMDNVGTNLLANSLMISTLGNIGGEVRRFRGTELSDAITKIENETGKLSIQDKADLVEALKNGVSPDEVALNARRIANGEVTPDEVSKNFDELFGANTPESTVETKVDSDVLSKTIAASDSEETISKLLKGKVPDTELPTLSKALKTVTNEDDVARILDEYNPKRIQEELSLKIATTDNEKKISTLLKGTVPDDQISQLSRIFKNMEDEVEIDKILQEFRAKDVPTVTPKETGVPIEKVEITPSKVDPLLQEAKKYKSAEEFVDAKIFDKQNPLPTADQNGFLKTLSTEDKQIVERLKDIEFRRASLNRDTGYKPNKISNEDAAFYKENVGKYKKRFNDYISEANNIKSQLTDLYNKAQGGVEKKIPKTEPKKTEAPKKKAESKKEEPRPTKTKSGLSATTLRDATKSGMEKELRDLDVPELDTLNMAEQADKAVKLIMEDEDLAIRIAIGDENPPAGLKVGSVYSAVKEMAIKNGDIDLIMRLATSENINALAREFGQEVKAFDSGIARDPVKVIKQILDIRKEAAGDTATADVKAAIKDMKDKVVKTDTTDTDVASFITGIKC